MVSSSLAVFDVGGICVEVTGGAERYFEAELGWFRVNECRGSRVLRVVEGGLDEVPFYERLSMREGRRFLHIPFGEIGKGSITLTYEPGLSPAYIYYVFEAVLHLELLAAGRALVHGTAFQLKGKGVWVTSWGGTGKTNLILHFLTSGYGGFAYMSDDWVIVDGKGLLIAYPKRMRVYGYNIAAYPGFKPGRRLLPIYRLAEFLYTHSPSRLVRIAIAKFMPKVVLSPQSIPGLNIVEKAEPRLVVLMRKYEETQRPETGEIDLRELVSAVVACVRYERDYFFKEYYRYVHYSGDRVDVIEFHDEKLSKVLEDFLDRAGRIVELKVPQHVGAREAAEIAGTLLNLVS